MSGLENPSPRGRPRTLITDKVLDATIDAYWRSDPSDVSVNTVCKLAGVSKPSLYRAFGSEDGLTLAALDRYAERVLPEIFGMLQNGQTMHETLDALIDFASEDPRMETGCLFYKMRAGKHRLGPKTRVRVEEINAAAQAAYATFLNAYWYCETQAWPAYMTIEVAANYLGEQIALAITQRASGEGKAQIRDMLRLALSVFSRP